MESKWERRLPGIHELHDELLVPRVADPAPVPRHVTAHQNCHMQNTMHVYDVVLGIR